MSAYLIVALIVIGLVAFFFLKNSGESYSISVEEMIENRKTEPGIVIDVRSSAEFYAGHLKIANHNYDLLSGEFSRKLSSLDKTETYYLYCASGNRSGKAAKLMNKEGFTNVYNIGGYRNLVDSGLDSE